AFFMDHMGVPLLMEPNFNDYSCQHVEWPRADLIGYIIQVNAIQLIKSKASWPSGIGIEVICHILNPRDFNVQFKFGVSPPEDSTLKEPCLEACPNATRRRTLATNALEMKCPKA
ncbi:beta-carotene isomerase D27, chloroplastic, partial [Tanacetum coccineum]